MKAKLTLALDNEIIKQAHIYANDNNSSISQLVADYFSFIFTKRKSKPKLIKTPILSEISGILSNENIKTKNVKEMYKKHLEKKYL